VCATLIHAVVRHFEFCVEYSGNNGLLIEAEIDIEMRSVGAQQLRAFHVRLINDWVPLVVLQQGKRLVQVYAGEKSKGDPMVDKTARHLDGSLSIQRLHLVDDNFALTQSDAERFALQLRFATHRVKGIAIVERSGHALFGEHDVSSECIRGFLLQLRRFQCLDRKTTES
jgi:hypothetical protein